jgi:hypothetical protein
MAALELKSSTLIRMRGTALKAQGRPQGGTRSGPQQGLILSGAQALVSARLGGLAGVAARRGANERTGHRPLSSQTY